jgi:hypothetical protein
MSKPKKKISKSSKSKLDTLKQTDGQGKSDSPSLEELLSTREINPFGTTELETLEDNLSSMNLNDLQRLAVQAGVMPSGNRTALKNKLKREFKKYSQSIKHTCLSTNHDIVTQETPVVDPDSEQGKSLKKLLNEGM